MHSPKGETALQNVERNAGDREIGALLRYNQTVLERVAEFITRYSMFRNGSRVGVAVSGGADSVCLLHALRELSPRWNLHLCVLHLNHRLRGSESDSDEAFVRELAAGLGLPAIVSAWSRSSEQLAGENLEQAARQARLAFFAEAMESGVVEKVALGHTRSDQAETVLFRFLRGSGTAGLAGVRPVTSTGLVRPLLAVGRAEVEEYLHARDISWRDDSTNFSLHFDRNRIRHELLPQLALQWNPALAETLANTADWASAEESYWETEIERLAATFLTRSEGAVVANAKELAALPRAVSRRLVRHAVGLVKGDLRGIDFGHIEMALRMAAAPEGHGRFQAPGLDLYRSFEWLRIARPGMATLENRNFRFAAPVPGAIEIPGSGRMIVLEIVDNANVNEAPGDYVYNDEMGCIDWVRVSGPLELRNWRPGDQFQPVGNSGEEKIKTLFQKARVPLWDRRHWPVLTEGASIIWARRFGPAARYAVDSGTRKVLTVRETEAAKGT